MSIMFTFTRIILSERSSFRKDILGGMEAQEETKRVRHIKFPSPLKIMMDGKKQHGVVLFSSAPS